MNINRISIPAEKQAPRSSGFLLLPVVLIGLISSVASFVFGCIRLDQAAYLYGGILLAVGIVGLIAFSILMAGFKVLAPNQAYVFTLFGKYYGTIKEPGFYHLNPFVTANAPAVMNGEATGMVMTKNEKTGGYTYTNGKPKKISLKTRTLDNRTQKVNDAMGNPIIIGSVVIWPSSVSPPPPATIRASMSGLAWMMASAVARPVSVVVRPYCGSRRTT